MDQQAGTGTGSISPMRIAQVSAHYPPNFVSGGTLVPQRIARLTAAQGHDSFVYAGYLDDRRRPLETWTETDEAGVAVTWLVTTPWTGWDDPFNYDNPGAAQAFARWLEGVRPDVVHVHSLQTLGVGLVEAARASGARVVLTMHDFWWFCSRQFLVDHQMHPCSLVVECGSCDCDSHPRLRGRRERLRRALEAVDLVLAPSHSAARVLVANGVDPDRVRVNENGLPDAQLERLGASPRPRVGTGPLRVMYAGGDQEMKGIDVLTRSARLVGEHSGLLLDAYGVRRTRPGLPSWFRPRPSFSPDSLLEVLGDHDLLVLPSVMRESHSILTREALAAGLGVVCTDTLGPEEAVAEGVNGHVVPAGDAQALAEVLHRLAQDPARARRLTGQGAASPIRSFTQQGGELLSIYEEVRDDAFGSPEAVREPEEHRDIARAQAQLLRRVLFIVGIDGAPLRYRAYLPAEALRMRGHEVEVRHYRDPRLREEVLQADAVVLYRVPATTQVLDLVTAVKERPGAVPVLYDVDDLIFDPSLRGQLKGLEGLSAREERLWWHGVERYRTTLEACDGFIGSTEVLCQEATRLAHLPAYRYANGVGALLARASDRVIREDDMAARGARTPPARVVSARAMRGIPGATGAQAVGSAEQDRSGAGSEDNADRGSSETTVSIGYFSGTTTHDADWAAVEPAVVAVMRRHPHVRLVLGGHLRPTKALSPLAERVSTVPFTSWLELPRVLRDTDICLAPLTGDSVFNEAKSAIKWLEAALVGRPVVAAATGPFQEVVEHGRTGMLATTTEQWEEALEELIGSQALRSRMGAMARREALLELSPLTQGRAYEKILVQAALRLRLEGRRQPSSWVPVADDEPFAAAPIALDPYGEDQAPAAVPAPAAAARASRLLWQARAVARTEGTGTVVRLAATHVARRTARGLARYLRS
ncbi:glycosyltransferase [Actinomyces wuliandei]|uniref:glycosyltransferase n=2 Tax=Actinomyces wuliandei TaxID=2057743 RepID=UPI000FDB8D12|nr:glycosyltransferase [Actinomyces wuliandei]